MKEAKRKDKERKRKGGNRRGNYTLMAKAGSRRSESESVVAGKRWRERRGLSGGAEHHVRVPWKLWAAKEEEKNEGETQ